MSTEHPMRFTSQTTPNGTVLLEAPAALAASDRHELRQHLERLAADNPRQPIHLDLTGTSTLDPSALAPLVAVQRHLRTLGTEIRLVNATPAVREMLNFVGVEPLFPIARPVA